MKPLILKQQIEPSELEKINVISVCNMENQVCKTTTLYEIQTYKTFKILKINNSDKESTDFSKLTFINFINENIMRGNLVIAC